MMGQEQAHRSTITTPSEREIHVERVFDAPRDRVFAAYTDAALIPEWWGPHGTTTVVDQMDVQAGGGWRFVVRDSDGSETGFRGTYREVCAPERIVQTFEWEGMPGHVSVETATFEDLGDRTKVVTTSIFHTTEERDGMLGSGMEGGMNETYERLDALLARLATGRSPPDVPVNGHPLGRSAPANVVFPGPGWEHMFVLRRHVVLHADVDAFFASVAQRDDPGLRGKPVIVGTGVVMAASYEARRFGIRSGMAGSKARRLCPQAIVVPSAFQAYVEASRAVFAVFERTAPLVERVSIEEAFVDITELAATTGAARRLGERLRREIREEVGLPISVGVGRTKIVAKMASRAAKPDGLLVVAPGDERAFLDPLAVEQLWGVGPATAGKLHERNLRTVGQLARLDQATLMSILGKAAGRHVHALAHNIDERPVRANRPPRSFGAQRALGGRQTPLTPEQLDATLAGLVDRVTGRMGKSGHAGRTVLLRLRFADYSRATRSHTLPGPTTAAAPILAAARALLAGALATIERRGLTLLGITVANVVDARGGRQLELGVSPED